MQKLNQNIAGQERVCAEEKVESALACFVNAVKTNLRSSRKKRELARATIRNAEQLKEKFNTWGSSPPGLKRNKGCGNHLYMDYIMHHRVDLATDIVKSVANGAGLSRQREKVLRNSIDYIEQRL